MKTKFAKIISVIIILIIMFNFNISYASDISDVFDGGNNFISAGQQSGAKLDDDTLEKTSDMIYNILLVLGMGIAVIISGILGIKFMMGSVEEKAQVKDQLIPFVIGCIVIFGAFSIWKIVVTFGRNVVPIQQNSRCRRIL